MANRAPELLCSNPECRVAETGKCVEGLDLTRCPHFGRAPTENAQTADDSSAPEFIEENPVAGIALPPGDRLTVDQASLVLRAAPARVVAIIGPTDAGKTSLVASLYDLFQGGPVGEFCFARSRTLYALEKACHHARAVSMRSVPHTERTPIGGVGFYHLGVCNRTNGSLLDILLADRAGEEYRSALDDPTVAAAFTEVHRADVITVLVDGHRLLDNGTRHNVRSDIEMMIQALADGDALSSGQRIAVTLTKLDEIEISPQSRKDRAKNDFDTLVHRVRDLFGSMFNDVEPFRIAASPATDRLPRGHGVSELLRFWTTAPVINAHLPVAPAAPERAMSRLKIVSS